ncbi:MAG: DUF1178 family protein [Rhizobiaceae bacterium]|jgi:hypothetical protein|nr:DUF1178 family protein [Rhizobiaceae bacterium]
MIRFSLTCDGGHAFDGWFASNDAFDTQRKRGLIDCPHCGTIKVDKAIMAPGVITSDRKAAPSRDLGPVALDPDRVEMMAKLREMVKSVRDNADHVGTEFAEEARKIHFGEAPERAIYGEASRDEVEALLEDGVPVAPLPVLPDDRN